MATLSRRTVIILLAAFVLLSVAIRYPLVDHERNQTDSYFIHLLSQSIVDNGFAKWTFHPLSYLGYYPVSYPSGVPFLMAEVSSLTGLNMEASVLLVDCILAIVFAFGVFGLARQFLGRPEYVLLATLFATLGPRFVDTTYWDASARGLVVVLTILVVFTAFRAAAAGQKRLFLVAFLLGIGCFVTHHMAVLLVVFGLGYLMASFQTNYLLKRLRPLKRGVLAASTLLLTLVAVLLGLWYFQYFEYLGFNELRSTVLFDLNPPVLSTALNFAVSYTSQIGFILLFAFLGIPSLFRKTYLRVENMFLLTLLIAFVPLLASSLYVSMLLTPFVAILGTAWLARLARSSRRKLGVAFVIVLMIASSIALPIWSTQRWNKSTYFSGETVEVSDHVFSDAIYLRSQIGGAPVISNNDMTMFQMAAISNSKLLQGGLLMALSGDVRYEDIQKDIRRSEARFPRNLYVWFDYNRHPNVEQNILALMLIGVSFVDGSLNYSNGIEYFSNHSRVIVAVDNGWPSSYVGAYSIHNSVFVIEVQRALTMSNKDFSSYKEYQSEDLTLYIVQLPL